MPDKGSAGNAKNDVRAPVIASPTKVKSGNAGSNSLQGKKAKETLRLPSISTSPSPGRKPQKNKPTTSAPTKSSSSENGTSSSAPRPMSATMSGMVSDQTDKRDSPNGIEVLASTVSDIPIKEAETAETQLQTSLVTEAVAAADQAAEEEATRLRKENGNGTVQLVYEQYDELFPIVDGSTTQANIDEVYCLSFVMPNCLVHLSLHPNAERFERENSGIFDSLVHEDPRGTFRGLVKGYTYYVVVEQEEDQLRRDQEATKAKWAPVIQNEKLQKDDGRGFETCSCIYGNPCMDEYGCKDWHSRFAVATANGWKGF